MDPHAGTGLSGTIITACYAMLPAMLYAAPLLAPLLQLTMPESLALHSASSLPVSSDMHVLKTGGAVYHWSAKNVCS